MLKHRLGNCGCVKYEKTAEVIKEVDFLSDNLKNEILGARDEITITGTAYYVAEDGCDDNDGLTVKTPIKSIDKVNTLELKPGDGVFFKRGDLFRGNIGTKPGVTYAAYGSGEKPRLYASPEDGAVAANWELVEGTTNIWKYNKQFIDIGVIVFNHGEENSIKKMPSWVEGQWVLASDRKTPFDVTKHMKQDLSHFSKCDTLMHDEAPVPNVRCNLCKGDLYLRCDRGNPGEVFESIEFVPLGAVLRIGVNSNVTIDNLCIKYSNFGISGSTQKNLRITNCEIGWIGGCIQGYSSKPETLGNAWRFGNGIEIYGGCDNFVVDHNYIYQCYDAGATHQLSAGGTQDCKQKNVAYTNNLFEYCIYNYEYFLGKPSAIECVRFQQNILVKGNIMRYAGFGFGTQRPESDTYFPAAHIKGWDHDNNLDENYVIEDNIFDRSRNMIFHCVAVKKQYLPISRNNIIIQYNTTPPAYFGRWGVKGETVDTPYDDNIKKFMEENVGDTTSGIYFAERDWLFDLPDYLPKCDRNC